MSKINNEIEASPEYNLHSWTTGPERNIKWILSAVYSYAGTVPTSDKNIKTTLFSEYTHNKMTFCNSNWLRRDLRELVPELNCLSAMNQKPRSKQNECIIEQKLVHYTSKMRKVQWIEYWIVSLIPKSRQNDYFNFFERKFK